MKGIKIFGDYVFEYLVITLLLVSSLVTVIPFIPIYVGVISYFMHKRDDRMLKDIFVTIKENWKIILKFTIFELILLVFSCLDLYFFNTHPENNVVVIEVFSYIVLVFGFIFLVHSPMIIITMNVNLRQLIFNSFVFFFGGFFNSLISAVLVFAVFLLASKIPYLIIPLLYFVTLTISYLTSKNYIKLKAKKLHISPQELISKEESDDYLDEYGEVKHD